MIRNKRLLWGIVAVLIVCAVFFYRRPSIVLNRTPCIGCVNELNARVIASWSRGEHVTQLAWSPSGKFLADGSSWNLDIEILETDHWTRVGNIRRLAGSPETYKMIAFTDDEHLLTPTADNRPDTQNVVLNRWDIQTGKIDKTFLSATANRTLQFNIARYLAVNPAKKIVAVISAQDADEPTAIYNTDNSDLLRTFPIEDKTPLLAALSL